MSSVAYVDQYCERLGPGLLAEPLNAATNIAFFLAAWALWRLANRSNIVSGDVRILIALTVAIGIGSSLFHTFATTWAHWLDIIPILLFQLAFLWIYTRRVMRLRFVMSAAIVAVFLVVALYSRQFPHLLNRSLMYGPALFVMLALGICHWRYQTSHRISLLAAAGTLFAAILFRTIDQMVCEPFPLGTHFLWHLLNAVVVYLCVLAVLGPSVKEKEGPGSISFGKR